MIVVRLRPWGTDVAEEFVLDAQYTMRDVEQEVNAAIEDHHPCRLALRDKPEGWRLRVLETRVLREPLPAEPGVLEFEPGDFEVVSTAERPRPLPKRLPPGRPNPGPSSPADPFDDDGA
jgi:hypothetical protein